MDIFKPKHYCWYLRKSILKSTLKRTSCLPIDFPMLPIKGIPTCHTHLLESKWAKLVIYCCKKAQIFSIIQSKSLLISQHNGRHLCVSVTSRGYEGALADLWPKQIIRFPLLLPIYFQKYLVLVISVTYWSQWHIIRKFFDRFETFDSHDLSITRNRK